MAASLIRSVAPLAISSGLYWALLTRWSSCCSCWTRPVQSLRVPASVLSDQISCSILWKPMNWDGTVTGFSQRPSICVSSVPQISATGSMCS